MSRHCINALSRLLCPGAGENGLLLHDDLHHRAAAEVDIVRLHTASGLVLSVGVQSVGLAGRLCVADFDCVQVPYQLCVFAYGMIRFCSSCAYFYYIFICLYNQYTKCSYIVENLSIKLAKIGLSRANLVCMGLGTRSTVMRLFHMFSINCQFQIRSSA